MKKLTPFIFFLLASCGNPEPKSTLSNSEEILDSVISKSSKNIQISDTVQKKSDSATEQKVGKIVKEIQYLTKFVEVLRIEKQNLSRELSVSKKTMRIDTVFIETKKNFWGKEKTTVNTKSDSSSSEIVDSVNLVETPIDSSDK